MGVFDLFGKEPRTRQSKIREEKFSSPTTSPFEQNKGPVAVFSPTSYKDVEKIIEALKGNKTAIVHLSELKPETAIRVLDMLSGAIFALDGGVYEMEKNIFMFSPSGIEVSR